MSLPPSPLQAPNPQLSSPLFTLLPPELRHLIFTFALSSFPDPLPTSHFPPSTCYTRPSYFSPEKTDVRLLRTCRAVYIEAWHLPFLLREQIHWLGSSGRAPVEYGWRRRRLFDPGMVVSVREQFGRGAGKGEAVEIERMRVFAQMWALEGGRLGRLLADFLRAGFGFKRVTLTVRHTDWWWWENDRPLYFEGKWVEALHSCLPSSVREFRIELESLERKKSQVNQIAKQMAEQWYFKRADNVALFADVTGKATEVDRWTGTSTWDGSTWTRDESRPGQIDYYIATVVFRPEWIVKRHGGQVNPLLVENAANGRWDQPKLVVLPEPGSEPGGGSEEDATNPDADWEDTSDSEGDGIYD